MSSQWKKAKKTAGLEVFQQKWHWGSETDKWLANMSIGDILHVCCGQSTIGDVRVDIAREIEKDEQTINLNPTVIADCHKLPFLPGSFDTVILDPPFKYFARIRWIIEISLLLTRRLIVSSPNIAISLKHFKLSCYATRFRNSMYVRQWFVYDRKNTML